MINSSMDPRSAFFFLRHRDMVHVRRARVFPRLGTISTLPVALPRAERNCLPLGRSAVRVEDERRTLQRASFRAQVHKLAVFVANENAHQRSNSPSSQMQKELRSKFEGSKCRAWRKPESWLLPMLQAHKVRVGRPASCDARSAGFAIGRCCFSRNCVVPLLHLISSR